MPFIRSIPVVVAFPFVVGSSDLSESKFLSSKPKKKLISGLTQAKLISRQNVIRKMREVGAPGMAVAVSVDGVTVWSEGFGLADVENNVRCSPATVMRVASISKSFTATAMARLWEEGKLDLDKPIQHYLPSFPDKQYDGEKVSITLRHLLSHTSGIRHYWKTLEEAEKPEKNEYVLYEYFLTKKYKNVTEALEIFKDDPLLKKPGEEYFYSTHAWTLISAILEEASGREFVALMQDNFRLMGMSSTVPDHHDSLVYGRARYYQRDKHGRLVNAPYVDNSWKWAGGGFLSTVGDLIKFGNIMMYSYQYDSSPDNKEEKLPGLLKSDTVKLLWNAVVDCKRSKESKALENTKYGLGWFVFPEMEKHGCCPLSQLEVAHTGGAIGASSVLFLLPNTPHHDARKFISDWSSTAVDQIVDCSQSVEGYESGASNTDLETLTQYTSESNEVPVKEVKKKKKKSKEKKYEESDEIFLGQRHAVGGIAVAIITNMHSVGLASLARTIAHEFDEKLQSV